MLLPGDIRDIVNCGDIVVMNRRSTETSISLLLSCTTLGAGKEEATRENDLYTWYVHIK